MIKGLKMVNRKGKKSRFGLQPRYSRRVIGYRSATKRINKFIEAYHSQGLMLIDEACLVLGNRES